MKYSIIAISAGIGIILLFLAFSGPVLIHYSPKEDPFRSPYWSILNPLRNRVPERVAELLLEELKSGKALEAFSTRYRIHLSDTNVIENENRFRLVSWKLMLREDVNGRIELFYHCSRANYPVDIKSDVLIHVEKLEGKEHWQVTSFSAAY